MNVQYYIPNMSETQYYSRIARFMCFSCEYHITIIRLMPVKSASQLHMPHTGARQNVPWTSSPIDKKSHGQKDPWT